MASFQQIKWDTTPLKLPGFWAYIKEQAPNENIKFKTLVENGFTVSSRSHQVCVVNLQHALQLQNRSFGPYTFDNPSPRNGPTTGLLPTSLTVTVAAPAPADASAPAAAPTTSIVPHVIGSGILSRYVEGPESIDEVDASFAEWILSKITNTMVRQQWATKCNNSGRELCRHIKTTLTKIMTSTVETAIQRAARQVLAEGLAGDSRCDPER